MRRHGDAGTQEFSASPRRPLSASLFFPASQMEGFDGIDYLSEWGFRAG